MRLPRINPLDTASERVARYALISTSLSMNSAFRIMALALLALGIAMPWSAGRPRRMGCRSSIGASSRPTRNDYATR